MRNASKAISCGSSLLGNSKAKALIATLLVTSCVAANADFRENFIDPEDGMFDTSKYLSENKLGFLPVPVIITEPAVGFGLGVVGVFFHESAEQRQQRVEGGGSLLPENISFAGLAATDNGTWGVGVGHLGFWKEDRLRYKGFLFYPSLNMEFYSLGGVELPVPVELNIEGPALLNQFLFRIGKSDWFAGAHQLFRGVETRLADNRDTDRIPPLGEFPPLDRFLDSNLGEKISTSGVGVVVQYDTRNNPFNPIKGYSYTFEYMRFDDAIGSDVNYSSYSASGLNYWQFGEKFNLGFRVQYDAISSDDDARLPAYVPPAISLRGVSAGRYQGNSVAVSEVQLDYQLNFRWKLGVFAGAGKAADSFGDLSAASTRVSKGAGFRYLIARRYGFVMGLDIAKGPEDSAFYIQAGSTW